MPITLHIRPRLKGVLLLHCPGIPHFSTTVRWGKGLALCAEQHPIEHCSFSTQKQ